MFTYGTLKPGEINHRLCAGQVLEAVRSYTWGELFTLPLGYPAMIPGNSRVEGFLLVFPDPSILTVLDELEDYQPNRPPQENEYYRQKRAIYTPAGEPLGTAWAYLMAWEMVQQLGGVLLPSGWWTGKRHRRGESSKAAGQGSGESAPRRGGKAE
ncbi:MAG: gamma-glutamylcyclotransferase [Cyanophyceae cyanobacterium]